MKVIVDGKEDVRFEGQAEDLFEVVGAINEVLRHSDRGIVDLRVDGAEVTPESMSEMLTGRGVDEDVVIEVESGSICAMAQGILEEMQQVLPELPKACLALAQVFQSEAPDDGFEPFNELAHVWSMLKIRQAMVLDSFDIKAEEVMVNGMSLTALHDELNGFLEEAAVAIENHDCVLLGDLLEYELAPRAEAEKETVAQLLRIVSQRADT
jgi:hypothetical protein